MSWLDKPDGDGLWWKQESESAIALVAIRDGKLRYVSNGGRDVWPHCTEPRPVANFAGEKWQHCELAKPEPYKPPTPPKVEWFTGWRQAAFHYIAIIGDRYIAIDEKGYSFSGVWNDVGEHNFATVRKMEPPT